MLTVKHVRFDGAETIDYCDRVIFYPNADGVWSGAPTSPTRPGCVSLIDGDKPTCDWTTGTVYVMNDNGSTIGKYDLGENHVTDDRIG